MSYTWIKQKGRVAILKDGEFDHQQFRGHFAYNNPDAYIAKMIERDLEAAEYAETVLAARRADAAEYLAARAERSAAQPSFQF